VSDKYREIVKKVNDAFANNDHEAFLEVCADDIKWIIVGDQTVDGKDSLREFMKSMEGMEAPKFTVEKIVSEGDSAAAYGEMTMVEKEGCAGLYEYCDVYTFTGEKISRLRSFIIKLKEVEKVEEV
jgi:ketosteroid isomerase-like protein